MKHFSPYAFALVLLALLALPILADADDGGITVTGNGTVYVMPDTLEISVKISGEGELASDAVVKFNDNKRHAVEAIEGLELENLTLEYGGISITSSGNAQSMQQMMMGQGAPEGAGGISLNETITISISGIDQLDNATLIEQVTQIVDAIKDAGLTMGEGPSNMFEMQMNIGKSSALVHFKVSDLDAAREQAYAAAMADANQQAERLAKLAKIKLGGVIGIQGAAPASEEENTNPGMSFIALMMGGGGDDKSALTDTFTEVPVHAALMVHYAAE